MRRDVDVKGVDDTLCGLAPQNGGHRGQRLERGGESLVAALGIGGDGEVSGIELGGRGNGEFGVLIADAVEGEFNGSTGGDAVGDGQADSDFRGFR